MEEKKALIFNILRGSMVDGHGIRTTVFLKGCPLRCLWCCNVEGQEVCNEIKVTPEICDGCGKCVDLCPEKAISLDPSADGRILQIDRGICTECGACADACSRGAIETFGRLYTVDELFRIIMKDQPTYRISGGGVTIAGGEATFFPEFTWELISRCKEEYIHTALDTCGYTLTDLGRQCLREVDLLLFDLKHMDSGLHKKFTGVPNEPILENLKMLNDLRKDIIIRVPVIPGYNDSEENLTRTAEFISGLASVERVDLIGYHNWGMRKYDQLGKKYPLDMPAADENYMQGIKEIFDRYGLPVQIGG